MRVVIGRPPGFVYGRALSAFGNGARDAYFTYGDTIYSPSGKTPGGDIFAHEEVHQSQQVVAGGPELWWERYFLDRSFRFQQELAGYRAQYRWWAERVGRADRRRTLDDIARLLSGPLYGRIVDIDTARSLLVE